MNINELNKLLDSCKNPVIGKSLMTTYQKINDINYNKILCSISGGSDSDILLDLCHKMDNDKKIDYVFFDTGLEYQATKEHLEYLENKYNINIERLKPKTPLPLAVKRYGQPFLNKHVSEMMNRLQKHGFKWEDEPYEDLVKKYPNCKSALQWWTNYYGEKTPLVISHNKLLKEFIISNPPNFNISNKCCKYVKKDLVKDKLKEGYDLNINGIRKSEGGIRQIAYKSCFDNNFGKYDNYRPIFWYNDSDKLDYRKMFNVSNSKCYSVYGFKRTGCCGCPYDKDRSHQLEVIEKFEPKLYVAVTNIFKESYEFTKLYQEFKNKGV